LIRSLNFRRGYLRAITNHIGLREHEDTRGIARRRY